jgi:hypothetical protein
MPTTVYQRTAMAAAIAACFPGAVMAAGVARVDFATGNVSAVGADGRSRALSRGSEVEVGETVSTQQGRAQLRFADGAYMSLQPQTELKVEEFRYSGKPDGNENIVMNLIKGGMRTITGLIGRTNRNAYRLKTDVATIGIRGTEYSVRYTNSIELFCADGAVSVENQSGSFTVTGGTGVMVSNQQTPPQQTDQKPVLPPESPVQEEEKQLTEKPAEPVNPIQEASPATPLLTGTIEGSWAVVHPSFPGTIGRQAGATITLDGTGNLTSFLSDALEGTISAGSSAVISSGNDGVIAWGRWANGVTAGNASLTTSSPSELHYIVGVAPTAMPTSGSATYSMIGATPPSSAESVTLNSSSLSINFGGTPSGVFHASFTVNGTALQTLAGGAGFSVGSGGTLSGGGCMTGACVGGNISLQGILAGAGAARAGMAYVLNPSFTSGAHGVIAYTKN